MSRNILIIAILLILASFLVACRSSERAEPDLSETQPLIRGTQAHATVLSHVVPYQIRCDVLWQGSDRSFRASDILADVIKRLGGPAEMQPVMFGTREAVSEAEVRLIQEAEANPFSEQKSRVVFKYTYAIVSLEPLIVLRSKRGTYGMPAFDNASPNRIVCGASPSGGLRPVLPWGFVYGLRAPWSDVVEWCSPNTGVTWQRVHFDNREHNISAAGDLLTLRWTDDVILVTPSSQ